MRLFHFILFILLLVCKVPLVSIAQELFPLHLDDKNTLPTNVVYNMAQDSNGFIWMATDEGLLQYDGFNYKVYKSIIQTSIPGSHIQMDRYGRVWYENFDGYLYYVKDGKMKGIVQRPPSDYVPYGITDNHLFVVQKKGVDVYDIKTLELIKTIALPSYIPEHATVKDNAYYFITDHVIYKIDDQLKVTTQSFFKDKSFRVKYIYSYRDQLYVVSKHNDDRSIYFFDTKLNFIKSITIDQVNYIQGSTVIDDKIIIYTSQGAFAYNEHGEVMWGKDGLLSKYSISSIIKDYQNNYWVSTTNSGVYIIPEMENKLYRLGQYLPHVIAKTTDGYWVGTQTGELLMLDDQFKIKNIVQQNDEKIPISYIKYDSINNWSVIASKGFYFIKDQNFKQQKHINVALKQIVTIDDKYLAYAASGYALLYQKDNAPAGMQSVWDEYFEQEKTYNIPNTSHLLKNLRAKSIDYNAAQQKIVIATNTGLYILTPTGTKEILINKTSFYAHQVFWIGDVIYALDTKGNFFKITNESVFELLNAQLGVETFEIKKIKKYGDQILLSGSQFIIIYNTKTQKQSRSQFNFGINTIRDFIWEQHHLLILTVDGILKIPIEDGKQHVNPRFFINKLYVNEKVIDWNKSLEFSYNDNNIKIDYSLLEYAGNHISLFYRINGGNWMMTSKQNRILEFPSLSPGKYVIEFMVDDNVIPETVNFEIGLPFWKAWWFYILIISIIGGGIYIYFRRESHLMRQQISLLNDKVELEKNLSKSVLTTIKSQMNPHFFYNALNTIQAYIFTNDKEKANSYLAKFSKLTRIVLEMSEKETVALHEEINSIKIYLDLEKMRFPENFDYVINIDEEVDTDLIEIPPMLIQPYVENAIKHGLLHRAGMKLLHLTFEVVEERLKITVDDNGIGRAQAEAMKARRNIQHQSFASKANEKRIEILNQMNDHKIYINIVDKYNENQEAEGTRVELFIPIIYT